MNEVFAQIILGHFVGDYLLQNKAMMFGKSKKGLSGIFWCTLHCLIYTAAVCLFLWTINPFIIAIVFLSHWPIDRWSLGGKWMKLIRSRDPKDTQFANAEFFAIVYVVVDNTWHILIMWSALNWFF